jgi:hypothetical protein
VPAPALEDTVDYAARNHVSPEPLAQDLQSLITTRRAAPLRGRLSTLICPGTENHPAATVGLKSQWTSQHRDFAGSRGRIGSPVQWVMSLFQIETRANEPQTTLRKFSASRVVAFGLFGSRLALKADGQVELLSRNGRDHARRFGEVVKVIAALPESTLILDGEVAMFDEHLSQDSSGCGMERVNLSPPLPSSWPSMCSRWVRRISVRNPYGRAGRCLRSLVEGQRHLPTRRLAGSGLKAWMEVEQRGYEGLVAKEGGSLYVGGRTLSWLKLKKPDYRVGSRGFRSR